MIADGYVQDAVQDQNNLPNRSQVTFYHKSKGPDFWKVSGDKVEFRLNFL